MARIITTTQKPDFASRGPTDPQGRSLRQFDLKTRLFKYPLSCEIYAEAFIKAPVQYAVLHRVGPVTATDLCRLEIPLLIAGGFTLAVVSVVLRGTLGMHGIPLIASALFISFASAIIATAIRPQGREVLSESRALIGRLLS